MKNADYWRRRAEILEESRYKRAKEQSDKAKKEFDLAQKTIDEQIEQWYARFAGNNEITLAQARQWLKGKDLEEFKWDVAEYIKRGKQAASNPAFIKQLENASARFHISKLEALKLKTQATVEQLYGETSKQSSSFFGEVYKDNYYHTAFTLQKGFGVGWDISGVNAKQVESVLSKPWTLDRQTFSDRIWKQKNDLLSEVHTQLTQNMILGKAPDDAIKAIAKKFNTSKSNAGRLVMTESAYFAIEAQKKAFEALDVEEYEIVATLDLHTSAICRDMDGQHLPMPQFETGVTAPPFHPWCRSTVVPYFADDEGERAARDPESGQTYYVPSNMKYNDWKKSFVDGGDKSKLQKKESGFVVEASKLEFVRFAQSLDDPYRSVYSYYGKSTDFVRDDLLNAPFGYSMSQDCVLYNPNHPEFEYTDTNTAFLHELAHRYDCLAIHSWENKSYIAALQAAETAIGEQFNALSSAIGNTDFSPFMQDILDALSKGRLKTWVGHDKSYWDERTVSLETFANLSSLFAIKHNDINFLSEYFPLLVEAFLSCYEEMI